MSFLNGTDPGLRQTRTPTVDTFAAGVGFTAGSSTYVTLSVDCGTEASLITTFDGITQHRDTYSYNTANRRVTFDAAIPTGVSKIECTYTTTIPATTPADGSVGTAQLADLAVSGAKLANNSVAGTKIALGSDAQGDIMYYNGTDYARLAKGTASQQLRMNSGATAPEWATVSGGKIAQVVQAQTASVVSTTSGITHDTSIPQISEGAEVLTCAITPTNASSTLYIFVDLMVGQAGGNVGTIMGLFKDSTADAIEAKIVNTGQVNNVQADAKFIHKISAGSTSEQTFKVRIGAAGSGTTSINSYNASDTTLGGVMKSSIVIMEVLP